MNRIDKTATLYSLLAGMCDGLTGMMLMAAPAFTLSLMNISELPAGLIYVQWIGAFVFSAGMLYFTPYLSREQKVRRQRAKSVLELTMVIRVVIAVFSGIAVLRGSLELAWVSVPLSDITMAVIQGVLLRMKAFEGPD